MKVLSIEIWLMFCLKFLALSIIDYTFRWNFDLSLTFVIQGDILENFAEHPPLSLPTSGFELDLENGPSDSSFYDILDAINAALRSGMLQAYCLHFR